MSSSSSSSSTLMKKSRDGKGNNTSNNQVFVSPTKNNHNHSSTHTVTPTPQEIADFDHFNREQREKITLYQQPIKTLCLFGRALLSVMANSIRYCILHPICLYFIIPSVALWLLLENIPGPYTEAIDRVEFAFEFVIWWLGLGILSSIGLGCGLQSGVLFLFPHIIKVCLAAQACKTLDFDSYSDIWFRSPKSLFKCPDGGLSDSSTPVTFFGIWKKVVIVCFLQATGTAIGEIPPYLMTRNARLAAIDAGTDNRDDIPEELEGTSQWSYINKFKAWMVRFLRNHGFWGVLLMASYPNIAFDLCGVCCGHFLMDFKIFFGATFLGKAVIRNGYQSVIYIALCNEKYLEWLVRYLQYLAPDSWRIDHTIRVVLEDCRKSFQSKVNTAVTDVIDNNGDESDAAKAFLLYWQIFMSVLLMTFFLSCVSQFAQHYQLTIDTEESNKLREKLPKSVKNDITSPASGRLRLPPATPHRNSEKNATPHRNSEKM